MEMNERQQLAALAGLAGNRTVPLEERLQAAMQVIKGLRKLIHSEECITECVCTVEMT